MLSPGLMSGSRPGVSGVAHHTWSPAANGVSNVGFYQRLGELLLSVWHDHTGLKINFVENTRAKIDFYSERLKQLAGTNFTKLTEITDDATTEQSKVTSSSSEEDKGNSIDADDDAIDANKQSELSSLDKSEAQESNKASKDANVEDSEVCVPDSSNTITEDEPMASDENQEEQHSSGSVDEELLDDDDITDNKPDEDTNEATEEEISSPATSEKPDSPSKTPEQHSLVGELMNKFGFSDILEYQEAYRKAVKESQDSCKVENENNNEQETHKVQNGLKLRSDISIDPEQNITNISKTDFIKNFETLKRLRPDLNNSITERESLFAGMNI